MSTKAPRRLCVTFLDVGQGDATIVLPPEGEGDAIVFDCGRDGWEVVQQLKTWGVTRLEAVIASHLDLDHVGGMLTVLDAFRDAVNCVYFTPDRNISDTREEGKAAKRLADSIHEGDGGSWELRNVVRDSRAVLEGPGWSVHLVAPRASTAQRHERTERWESPNRYSGVLRIQMGPATILVGGDAPLVTWGELHEGDELGTVEVFRTPHHGGALDDGGVPDSWSADRLYEITAPSSAAVSVGTNNDHGHPDPSSWIRPLIHRPDCRLLCTQVTGGCHSAFSREGNEATRKSAIQSARERWLPAPYNGVSHFTEPPWRHYRCRTDGQLGARNQARLEVPCAGTISVSISEGGDVVVDPAPDNVSLVSRIDGWTAPLCRGK